MEFPFDKADLQACIALCDLEITLGESTGALVLMSATEYLKDRANYRPRGWSETV